MWNPFRHQARISHPGAPTLYSFHQGRLINNGAQTMAFNPLFQLPNIVFRGAGRVAGSLNVMQYTQLNYNNSVPMSSFGGIQVGQIVGQPLLTQNPQL
jgi:hypothetical protein